MMSYITSYILSCQPLNPLFQNTDVFDFNYQSDQLLDFAVSVFCNVD